MDINNVINLNEYRQTRANKKEGKSNNINSFKKEHEEDDRRNTFNLFMRVLATMRQESY